MQIPSQARAWFRLGVAGHHANRIGESLSSLDRAVKIDPGDPEAWSERGFVLLE